MSMLGRGDGVRLRIGVESRVEMSCFCVDRWAGIDELAEFLEVLGDLGCLKFSIVVG